MRATVAASPYTRWEWGFGEVRQLLFQALVVHTNHRAPLSTYTTHFTSIPGVGPATERKLNDAGIYTYDGLARLAEIPRDLHRITGHTVADKIRAWLSANA